MRQTTSGTIPSLRGLCLEHTPLTIADIERLETLAASLPQWAALAQADVFIDCLTECADVAIVVAEANPEGRSLYRAPVVGQLALRENEPGVLETLTTDRPTLGRRGLSQEGVPVRQSVVPVNGAGGITIGALIMEQDVTEELKQEARIGLLAETTEQLTETLLSAVMQTQTLPSLLHEGLIVLDNAGVVSYANPTAHRFLSDLGATGALLGRPVTELPLQCDPASQADGSIVSRELHAACASFMLRSMPVLYQQQPVGHVVLIRDITEIRVKDKELMVKSAVIKEIHHRVKNNLQTIGSLLRLQSRRVANPEVKRALAESINRIGSIATVHEALSKGGIELVDLVAMTEDIIQLIRANMIQPERPISIEVTGNSLVISSQKATSVALIINEVVQNALDHAYSGLDGGRVTVAIEDLGGSVDVRITDDGTGIADDLPPPTADSLGLQIVRTLVEHDLKGRLSIKSIKGCGTEVRVLFPKGEGEVGGGGSNGPDCRR